MSEAIVNLVAKVVDVIGREKYQPGYPKWSELHPSDGSTPLPAKPGASKTTTWCNEAANAVLVELGYDTRPILEPRGIGWTHATKMVENAIRASGARGTGVFEVTPRQAQAWANIGVPVLAAANDPAGKQSGHLGIVCPTDAPWNEKAGPWIGQAGAVNGFRSAADSFTKWGLLPPRYFLLPIKV